MSGIRGFTILTIALLLLAFLCLSIGNTSEMTDEQYMKEYNETLIGEIDYPLTIPCIIKRSGQDPIYDWVKNPYLMADVHREKILIFFSYREDDSGTLPISKVMLNNNEIEFIQDDAAIEDEGKSFVVIPIPGNEFAKNEDIEIEVIYGDNKLEIQHMFFIISDRHLDSMFGLVVEMYKDYKESEIEL